MPIYTIKKIISKSEKKPLLKNASLILSDLSGKSAKRICEPSKGKIGSRLKTPRIIFNQTKIVKKLTIPGLVRDANLKTNPTSKAIKKLELGPAKPIRAGPQRLFLKFIRLKGTGFPQPNPIVKSKIAPIGSKCRSGFTVKRPSSLAVLSPKKSAAWAWAYS